jgi:hypothetical protein
MMSCRSRPAAALMRTMALWRRRRLSAEGPLLQDGAAGWSRALGCSPLGGAALVWRSSGDGGQVLRRCWAANCRSSFELCTCL